MVVEHATFRFAGDAKDQYRVLPGVMARVRRIGVQTVPRDPTTSVRVPVVQKARDIFVSVQQTG